MEMGPAGTPETFKGDMLPEHAWVTPIPDTRVLPDDGDPAELAETKETIKLAFVTALQHLPARQRAVLILRDVLGFSAREVAASLQTTPVSVDSALQRAHKTVHDRMPERSQQATLRALDDRALRATVDRFREAWERADVQAVKTMLAEDAVLAMPPHPAWYAGREQIAQFLQLRPFADGRRERLVPVRANGQLAFAHYTREAERFVSHAISVLTLRGAEIADVTVFRTPELFARFGLPETLPTAP